ncbi:MAG: hypothetical protein CMP49_05315 [Flavobacteriales bacterium]|nr:hypothetical protein [Flavobacteriales bacterium]
MPNDSTQVKIESSINYDKLPFKMKMMKNMLPNKSVSYYSKIGNRTEIDTDGKIMGKKIISSTIIIQNYRHAITSIHMSAKINDSIVENVIKKMPIPKNPNSIISFYDEHRKIHDFNCVYFISENDSIKIDGFLTKEISGVGEFENVGMPLDYTTNHKKDKYISSTKVQKILIEPFNDSKYIIYD